MLLLLSRPSSANARRGENGRSPPSAMVIPAGSLAAGGVVWLLALAGVGDVLAVGRRPVAGGRGGDVDIGDRVVVPVRPAPVVPHLRARAEPEPRPPPRRPEPPRPVPVPAAVVAVAVAELHPVGAGVAGHGDP